MNTLLVGNTSIITTRLVYERDGAEVRIGNRTFIGEGAFSIASLIEIGDDVMIAWGVVISDHTSHSIRFSERKNDVKIWLKGEKDWNNIKIAPVRVGNKVWIGLNSIILHGITIGEGAIVGAGSVVTKDVPPWKVVAGNPARIIRHIGEDER